MRILDCCLISDGAAALVVSAHDAARDTAKPPVEILGMGQAPTHEHIFAAPSLTEFGCRDSAAQAFGESGVGPDDMDVIEVYDSFTIILVAELESIGFYKRGEARAGAVRGEFDLDAPRPCNTHGGLLSWALRCIGRNVLFRGSGTAAEDDASARQVKGAKLDFVHNDGGVLSAHGSAVLGRA